MGMKRYGRTWMAALGAGLAAAALLVPVGAAARAPLDCPMRDAPFSADLPLIDVLADPAAAAILRGQAGAQLDKAPPGFLGTTAPSFAAILSVRQGGPFLGLEPAAIARIDAALRKLPVTAQTKVARCARYDATPLGAVPQGPHPRVLVFEKINGFKDKPSVDAAHAALLDLAKAHGWTILATDRGGAFTLPTLRHFDVVVWNNISGDVLTVSQRKAFRQWLQAGGAYLGIHGSAGDPVWFWPWYADTLLGARFIGHPMTPQFQAARIAIESDDPVLTAGLPQSWTWTDEWYSFAKSPRTTGARILATLDESTYDPKGMHGESLAMGDHPIAWTRCIGRGRMFYSAIGHRPESYADPRYRTMMANAVAWAAAPASCAR
ncbi:ThuA domain-containing protein [Novosphingobium sp. SG720]|uniref:ThuA domain-containing protein n=1 Tax=Novosphingobium sp. SG720 TaxID=2586998 RepID=UPI001446D13E|nr:ThuA domain-containing protein [Novosphingobium sp. SG720]NKJ41920.1 hypothetical protein [Novosphingobium sp. SG720]